MVIGVLDLDDIIISGQHEEVQVEVVLNADSSPSLEK